MHEPNGFQPTITEPIQYLRELDFAISNYKLAIRRARAVLPNHNRYGEPQPAPPWWRSLLPARKHNQDQSDAHSTRFDAMSRDAQIRLERDIIRLRSRYTGTQELRLTTESEDVTSDRREPTITNMTDTQDLRDSVSSYNAPILLLDPTKINANSSTSALDLLPDCPVLVIDRDALNIAAMLDDPAGTHQPNNADRAKRTVIAAALVVTKTANPGKRPTLRSVIDLLESAADSI